MNIDINRLKKVGYEFEINENGYKVTFKGDFVFAARTLPRDKPRHWRHNRANIKEYTEYSIYEAKRHAQKNNIDY